MTWLVIFNILITNPIGSSRPTPFWLSKSQVDILASDLHSRLIHPLNMLTHTLRPFTRAVRQLSTRSFYQTPSHSHTTRNATIASLALFAGGGVVYSFRSRPLLADDRVRTSVLDQDSLKQDIHSRPGMSWFSALVFSYLLVGAADGMAQIRMKDRL